MRDLHRPSTPRTPRAARSRRDHARGRLVVTTLLAFLGATALPSQASAQFWRQLGVGANIGLTEPVDGDVGGALLVGGGGGMAPEHGWGFTVGLGWFEADLIEERGSDSRRLGELKVRPIMGGVGYTWLRGRVAATASLTAGVSLNDGSLDDALAGASSPAGTPAFAIDVGNSLAVRPAFEVEYFLGRKFALTGTLSYLHTRPEIVVTTPEGRLTDRWNASSVNLVAGFVVYPFR